MSALLSVTNLSKSYGALKVTQDVDLDVRDGELHAIIGPNGAGKTTLINQLSGMATSSAGQVTFDGQDITHWHIADRVRAGLARSFQITSVLPGFSVLDNVATAIQARSGSSFRFFRSAARDAALNAPAFDLLERFGLQDRAGVRAELLSHGEKRQLELAIALATAPRMLLLDEPLAGTSHDESRRIVETLRTLKGTIAILLIEHDMEAVFGLADRVSVLVYGRLIATGRPDEIRANAEVRAAYLGEEAA